MTLAIHPNRNSMQAKRPCVRGKAFTLVELLVVIGIIAVMISMLLPALQKVRASVQSLSCMSNLRQIGIAFNLYASANSGRVILYSEAHADPSSENPASNMNARITWEFLLQPLLGRSAGGASRFATNMTNYRVNQRVMQCPIDPWFIDGRLPSAPGWFDRWTSYALADTTMGSFDTDPTSRTVSVLNYARVNRASEVCLFTENHYANSLVPFRGADFFMLAVAGQPGYQYWHPGLTQNFLFLDGHVENLKKPQHMLANWGGAVFLRDGTRVR